MARLLHGTRTMFPSDSSAKDHPHCWHVTLGPIYVALKDGYVHQTCCKCPATRVTHMAHVHD